MTASSLQTSVLRYFRGVDTEDLPLLLGTLSPNCVFSIETHGVTLNGHDEITGMFERLWSNHKSVCHENFYFTEDHENGLIATRFRVVNVHHDDQIATKSNCNFFTSDGDLFSEVRVYMAGENTLDHKS